jgi:ribosomal protein S18 acetylase RimI-like enzyme
MASRIAAGAAVAAIAFAGCSSSEPDPLPAACLEGAAVATALERAPATVTLPGGTALSRCVSLAAAHDGDLQALGVALMRVADDLHAAARSDPRAAERLGYLIGSARRGAARTPGIASQLARRLEQTASFDDALTRGVLLRGVAFGEETG